MPVISLLLISISIYLVIGFIFAIVFIIRGVTAIDEGAKGSGLGFRIIIIPGVMVFWPMLLKKWIRSVKHPAHD